MCERWRTSIKTTPKGKGRFRYGFPNDEFYLKSSEEMVEMFSDIPEAVTNISDLIKK